MHWGKFSDALRDMTAHPCTDFPNLKAIALMGLKEAQRFYLPNGSDVLEGKIIDEQMQKFMHLPYPVTAILHESFVGELTNRAWLITLAVEHEDEPGFQIISLMRSKQNQFWVPAPVVGLVRFCQPFGYNLAVADTDEQGKFSEVLSPNEFLVDAAAIFNLCALLGTVAKTEVVAAPPKLNKARIKAGKTPLPSYHVLNVGGEKWDSPHVSGGHGHGGVRSHLRRGHIRHLSEERFVWVRSTIVVGSREGFADKEYKVE